MRQTLAPMLFDDHDRAAAATARTSPVAKAKVSKPAYRKAATQHVDVGDGASHPVHGFRTLLVDLATLTRNTVYFGGQQTLTVPSTPTQVQRRALSLLGSNRQHRRQHPGPSWRHINGLHQKGGKVRAKVLNLFQSSIRWAGNGDVRRGCGRCGLR
jgi:hypothetical protein